MLSEKLSEIRTKAVVDCSKLGIFYALIKMHDKETLWTYIPDSLHRLYQNDIKKNGELIDTLECFLNNNQSLKKHRNRCIFITGQFLSSAEDNRNIRNGFWKCSGNAGCQKRVDRIENH